MKSKKKRERMRQDLLVDSASNAKENDLHCPLRASQQLI